MTSTYPAQIDTIITLPQAPAGTPAVSGDTYNQIRSAVIAVENELGVNPSGTNNTVRARLDVMQGIITNFQGINLGGDIGGTTASPHVIGIQGRPISTTVPVLNQFLIWNGVAWVPNSFAGDLANGLGSQTVIGLQGRPVSSAAPSTGQLLEWNGTAWTPTNEVFSGDLAGNYSNQVVIRINGATVPVAGALTIGNVLQVSGNSALTYAPVNLGGGSNYVIGILPTGNQASQLLHGDVTGTTSSNTVVALQGNTVSSSAPSASQALIWSGSAWSPTNIPVQFVAGGDLTGTATNQTVSSIQGLKVAAGNTANALEVAAINYNAALSNPLNIVWSGSSLWVLNSGANYVTKLAAGYASFTNYNLFGTTHGACIAANGTYVFVGVSNGVNNKLVVLNGSTGAIVGLGAYAPSGSHIPTAITLDDNGMVWTVDNSTLQGWSISSLIANGPSTPTAPSKSLSISGCLNITFGVTSGGHHYLFVRDTLSHIYSVDPTTPAIISTYTDGSLRDIDYLLFTTGIGGGTFLWASTIDNNVLLKINPDTMALVSAISSSGTGNNLEFLSQDGTYIYAGDTDTGKIEIFNATAWNSEIIPNVPGAGGTYGLAFDGTYVNAISRGTYPAVQEMTSFGAGAFFIGPNELTYQDPTFIGTYAPSSNTLPTRGNFGESEFAYINLNTSNNSTFPLATNALININADNQTVISAYSNFNAPNNITLLQSTGDQAIIGDTSFCLGVQLLSTGLIATTGGRVDTTTKLGDGANYSLQLSDRIILFTGGSGRQFLLPTATGSNRIVTFIAGPLVNNSGNSLIVVPHTGDVIGSLAASADWWIYSGGGSLTIQDTAAGTWTILERSRSNIGAKINNTHTILAYEDVVSCDTTSTAFTVTLPASPMVGQRHDVHDVGGNAGTNNITVASGGNLVNGLLSSVTINAQWEVRHFVYTGLNTIGWQSTVSKVS